MIMKNFKEFSVELDEVSNDYFKRRKDEEDRIAGTKAPAKRKPKQTDYEKKRKEQMKEDIAICSECGQAPCCCDDSHGFVSEAAQGHTIEATGIRGMKGTTWRKTFKSHEHLSDWADKNDSIEVHAVRDLEGVKRKTNEEALSEAADQHKVVVTVSEKDHPMVSKRLEKQQKRVIVSAKDKDEAVAKAKKFYTKQGYHVHDAEYHSAQPKSSLKTEETIDELSTGTLTSYKKKAGESATVADKAGDTAKGHKRFKGIMKATFKQFANDAK